MCGVTPLPATRNCLLVLFIQPFWNYSMMHFFTTLLNACSVLAASCNCCLRNGSKRARWTRMETLRAAPP